MCPISPHTVDFVADINAVTGARATRPMGSDQSL